MESKGIESFKAAVMKDCKGGNDCFNENGCDHEYTRMEPETNPGLLEMGIKQICVRVSKCFHKYCDKYKWVIDRAKHYSEKTGISFEQVLENWETDRSYWYMNFYQDCNQPLIESASTIMYDEWIAKLRERFGEDPKDWAFKCPACGNVQTVHDFIEFGIKDPESHVSFNCIGRFTKVKGCDWSLGGLLNINKLTVIKDGKAFPVFEMAELKQ